MTSEYPEYSEQIRYAGWPAEWRLDQDEEEQLEVNIEEGQAIVKYLEHRRKIGTKSNSPKIKKPRGNL